MPTLFLLLVALTGPVDSTQPASATTKGPSCWDLHRKTQQPEALECAAYGDWEPQAILEWVRGHDNPRAPEYALLSIAASRGSSEAAALLARSAASAATKLEGEELAAYWITQRLRLDATPPPMTDGDRQSCALLHQFVQSLVRDLGKPGVDDANYQRRMPAPFSIAGHPGETEQFILPSAVDAVTTFKRVGFDAATTLLSQCRVAQDMPIRFIPWPGDGRGQTMTAIWPVGSAMVQTTIEGERVFVDGRWTEGLKFRIVVRPF
jgi:hypothetical protein